jgi:spore coat polysaccharide biosynthesis protein SpsF
MRTVASIQARLSSTRLPGKVLFSIGSKKILERVVDQCDQASNVDEVVLTIGDNPENKAITSWAERNDVDYVSEVEENLLLRHYAVADAFSADSIVRVTADAPFIPTNEIERLVSEHQIGEDDYSTNWTKNTPIGAIVEVISEDALTCLKQSKESHPIMPIRENPDGWKINYSESEVWLPYSEVHMAVDKPEDYWNLVEAYDARGNNPLKIAQWLENK